MKSRFFKVGICIAIFLFLIVLSNLLLRPVYSKIGSEFERSIFFLQAETEKKCGLKISFQKFSPSILRGIAISEIQILDSKSGLPVVSVKNAWLSYSIRALLKGDFSNAIKRITFRDCVFELYEGENDFWISKAKKKNSADFEIQIEGGVKSEAGGGINSQVESESEKEAKRLFEILSELDLSFLKDVRIYRLFAKIKKRSVVFEANISRAFLSAKKNGNAEIAAGGFAKSEISGKKISANLDFSASIPKGFEEGTAILRLSNIHALDFYARNLGFLAEYKNKILSAKTLPGTQNIFAQFSAELESGNLDAKVLAENFRLSRFLQSKRQSQISKSLFEMNFSFDASVRYNFQSKKFSYNSRGNVFVPASAIPAKKIASNTLVSYSLYGDKSRIFFPSLSAKSERANFSCEGNFNFFTKKPEGNLYLESFVLQNGGIISAEIFVEPTKSGFMCFSPQVNFGEKSFTAAQLNVVNAKSGSSDSLDFTFEVYDYPENLEAGTIFAYGSLAKNGVFQASLSLDTVSLQTAVLMAAFFSRAEMRPLWERAGDFASPFVFSCDAFASGEGGEYAFNIPYAFVANTLRDDQMLMLSLDGNRDTTRISSLEFAFAGQRLSLSAESVKSGKGGEREAVGRVELNGLPYNFTGLFSENWMSINSEYGFQLSVATDASEKDAVLSGNFSVSDFPLYLGKKSFSLTNETRFTYSVNSGLEIDVPVFHGKMIGGANPVLSFSMSVDSGSAIFEPLSYSDDVSTLAGKGSAFWLSEGEQFEEANFNFSLEGAARNERASLFGEITNPQKNPLNVPSLFSGKFLKGLSVNATLEVNSLCSKRFARTSRQSDTIEARLSLEGPLENLSARLSVPRADFAIKNESAFLRGEAVFSDKVFEARDIVFDFGSSHLRDIEAKFDLEKFSGEMGFNFETSLLGKKYESDARLKVEAVGDFEGAVPPAALFSLETGPLLEGKKGQKEAVKIEALKMQNDIAISSSKNVGVSGMISNFRDVDLKIKNPLPFEARVEGFVSEKELNLAVSDVSASVPNLVEATGTKVVKAQKGVLTGGFAITGSAENPHFSGLLEIAPAEFNMPRFFKRRATTQKIALLMQGSQFFSEPTRCYIQRVPVDVSLAVQMNGFAFESLDVHLQTTEGKFVPLNMNLSEIHVKGAFLADMDINYERKKTSVSGSLVAKDTNAEFGATRLNEIFAGFSKKKKSPGAGEDEKRGSVDVALAIKADSRVQIGYSSFLRGVVVPGSEVEVTYLGDQSRLLLEGNVPIKSGEISYLNTNFFIKEGQIHFSDADESFDPRISVRAETKTRDENNENVTVSLSVENQHLSELSPRLAASPARSEREIMEILGTIITADSENVADLALATGDYAIQSVVTRKLENTLRDLFKFDIFSLRTMAVQNAVRQGFERDSVDEGGGGNPAGNYLDGTTVYIGKYLGDSMFADAMLRLDYDENRIGNDYTVNGLSFRPEVGFELDSPFVNLRWSMSPDFEDLVNLNLVQNTALTFSWKFTF